MPTTAEVTSERAPRTHYARLEERILARDQIGASQVLYELFRQHRPVAEIVSETVRIHAPYTHVPYHQRLDDGVVRFVNNDHCLLSVRVGLPLMSWSSRAQAPPAGPERLVHPDRARSWNQLLGRAPGHYTRLTRSRWTRHRLTRRCTGPTRSRSASTARSASA